MESFVSRIETIGTPVQPGSETLVALRAIARHVSEVMPAELELIEESARQATANERSVRLDSTT